MSPRLETDPERIRRFMQAVGRATEKPVRIYFTGGATALLLGWRELTIDVDIKIDPEEDSVFRALPKLKEDLSMNIELASPADFIPPLPGWEPRSPFIESQGKAQFFHYDLYSQALAKIERGHRQDIEDVQEMLKRKLIDRLELERLFGEIEPRLYRYPALDPADFRSKVEEVIGTRVGK
jgi:hypothetical protein